LATVFHIGRQRIVMTTIDDARFALAAKSAAEQNLANLSLCPPWRHAAFAGLMASLIAASAVPIPARFAIFALMFVAGGLIYRADRRRLGVFINGYRRGKTRVVALSVLAPILVLHAASTYFGVERHQPAICLILAAVAFVIAYQGSVIWQRVFRLELGA